MKILPRVRSVRALKDSKLRLTFTNGESRIYDMATLIEQGGVFAELKNSSLFRSVKPAYGSVQWAGGQDVCPDTLYLDSVSLDDRRPSLTKHPVRASSRSVRFQKPTETMRPVRMAREPKSPYKESAKRRR